MASKVIFKLNLNRSYINFINKKMFGKNCLAETDFINTLCKSVETRMNIDIEQKPQKISKENVYKTKMKSTYSQFDHRKFLRKYEVLL